MKDNVLFISRSDFLDRSFDAHSFYDVLPSDPIHINCTESYLLKDILKKLLLSTLDNVEITLLDELSICLVNGYENIDPSDELTILADRFSAWYAQLLVGGKSNRPLRMRLQQLNFFIRDILDKNQTLPHVDEEFIDANSPWDFLQSEYGRVLVTSDVKNFHLHKLNGIKRWTCGFPSQVDLLLDGKVSIGSIFSKGGWLFCGVEPVYLPHTEPIVLFFDFDDIFFIDCRGGIYQNKTRQKIYSVGVSEVSKVRFIDRKLYIFDWSRPNTMLCLDLDTHEEKLIILSHLLLGNDICRHKKHFYMLDKQQGYIFKYDDEFNLIGQALAFGKGVGRLYDPISIRVFNGCLQVLNWVTNKVVTLGVF